MAPKWDHEMNAHLFLAISEVLNLTFTPEHKDAITNKMRNEFGHDVNWNGIRQHLQKLKKKDGNGSEPATPKKAGDAGGVTKAKKVATPKCTPTGKRRKAQALVDAEDVDEDEEDEKAIKKLKLRAHAPNPGQNYEVEPAPPTDGYI